MVAGPLHPAGAPLGLPQPPGAASVQVAHALTTLPGLARAVDAVAAGASSPPEITIEVFGLPRLGPVERFDLMAEAVAVACLLLGATHREPPGLQELDRAGSALVLQARGRRVALRCTPVGRHGPAQADGEAMPLGIEIRAGGAPEPIYRFVPGVETSTASAHLGDRPCPGEAERAVELFLAPGVPGLDTEAAGLDVLAQALARAPALALPGGARLAAAARRTAPGDLAALGLSGDLPAADPAAEHRIPVPAGPTELWSHRAGDKPVVFLTVPPAREEATLALFEGLAVERRPRRVAVGPQDRWDDRRSKGREMVELYLSRDPALARRAAELSASGDPTASAVELGALLGYPACCVRAFAAQQDRSNNTLNRYEIAARTLGGGGIEPWAWELDDLSVMLVPFFPCTFRCPEALRIARAALAEMERAHPGVTVRLRDALARPVLYFDHDHQVVLAGRAETNRVHYSAAAAVGGPLARRLAGAIALGDALVFAEGSLTVSRAGRELFELSRTDPALGLVAPFGGSRPPVGTTAG